MISTKHGRRGTTGKAPALCLAVAALVISCSLLGAKPARAATTFTVNSTADGTDLDFASGTFDGSSDGRCDVDSSAAGNQCTLRAAIQQANIARGADTISFSILVPSGDPNCSATTKVCTILSSGLPAITGPVTVDGYTQGDATADASDDATENTLSQPDRSNAVLRIQLRGFDFTSSAGVTVESTSNVVVKGLAISNFFEGVLLAGGTGNRIEGNFIGTDFTGTRAEGNDIGVHIAGADGSTVGGASPAARNLVSGNELSGVRLAGGASANAIQGNLIGATRDGNPLGNGRGVEITSGSGNRILSNSVHSNTGLGIDLAGGAENADGVTANDGDDPGTARPDPDKDTGPNRLQNLPSITSASTFFGGTTISGTLESTPSTKEKKRTFIIQFFSNVAADPSGHGEGQTPIGQVEVKTDRSGAAPFSFAPSQTVPEGRYITATATNKATGDTSEFSNARVVEGPVIGQ